MAAADVAGMDPIPDEVLIQRIGEGDQEAFELLYERYFPRVYNFLNRRLNNRADTEETVQEVFINVFSSLDSYRREAPFGAWVLGVSRRTLAARFKKKRHATVPLEGREDTEVLEITAPTIRREPTPLEHYECGEWIEQLEAAARKKLTQEQRTLFVLHHLRHRSIQEIARTLRKSEDAIKSNLYRARKLLLARS